MRFFKLGSALGAISFAFVACSSSEHRLGENASGAGITSGASGSGNSGGATSNGGEPGLAGGTSGGSAAGGSTAAGSGNGGSSGNGNAAGDNGEGGAIPMGGSSNVAGSSGTGGGGIEASCVQSGGTVTTALCCGITNDFPALCPIGACGCAPTSSHEVKVCTCPGGTCFDGQACVTR